MVNASFSTVPLPCFNFTFILKQSQLPEIYKHAEKDSLFSWKMDELVAKPMPCSPWTRQPVFPTKKDLLLHKHKTTEKMGKMTSIHSYHLIFKVHWGFTGFLDNVRYSKKLLIQNILCVYLSCGFSPLQSGTIPQSLLDFHAMNVFKDYRVVIFSWFLISTSDIKNITEVMLCSSHRALSVVHNLYLFTSEVNFDASIMVVSYSFL